MSTLARTARPRSLDAMIGQERVVAKIREQYRQGRLPNSWMFYGSTGAGKTTIARILAVALQCKHQEKFGQPCVACWRKRREFPIHEINAAELGKKEDIEKLVELADYRMFRGQKHVFIFDEAHGLSRASQNLLLKRFEDSGKDVYEMLCTTEPNGILTTLRRRCGAGTYKLRPFGPDETLSLVKRLLKKIDSSLSPQELADVLVDKEIRSPGLMADAVDNYAAGDSAEEAIEAAVTSGLNTKRLCVAVTKGAWQDTANFLRGAADSDARAIRVAVIGYLRTMLLDAGEMDKRSRTIANAIKHLGYLSFAEDRVQITALAAELHLICRMFS